MAKKASCHRGDDLEEGQRQHAGWSADERLGVTRYAALWGEVVGSALERSEKDGGRNNLAHAFYLVRNRFAKERKTTAMGLKVLTHRDDGLLLGV